MATYFGTMINDSPTIVLPAGSGGISGAQCKAVKVSSGTVVKAGASDAPIGVVCLSDDDNIAEGADVNVQIKDIGMWVSGAAVAVGDELAADSNGCCVKATAGKYVLGIALSAAAASGVRVRFQITKSGYVPTDGTVSLKLEDLTDVDLTTPATAGQVLKFDGDSSKWKAAADATE